MLYEPSARTFHCITRNSEVFPSETFSSLLQLMKILSSKGGNLWRALSRSFRASFRALSWQEPAVVAAMMLTRYTIVIKFEVSNIHQQSPLTANGRSSIQSETLPLSFTLRSVPSLFRTLAQTRFLHTDLVLHTSYYICLHNLQCPLRHRRDPVVVVGQSGSFVLLFVE